MARPGPLACNGRGALATHSHPTSPGWVPGHSRPLASVGNWAWLGSVSSHAGEKKALWWGGLSLFLFHITLTRTPPACFYSFCLQRD